MTRGACSPRCGTASYDLAGQVGGRGYGTCPAAASLRRAEPRLHDAGKLVRRVWVFPPVIERT